MLEVIFRAVAHLVIEIVFVGIFYWPGWLILRVVTLGRYPPAQAQAHRRAWVAITGFVFFLMGLTFHFSGGAV